MEDDVDEAKEDDCGGSGDGGLEKLKPPPLLCWFWIERCGCDEGC